MNFERIPQFYCKPFHTDFSKSFSTNLYPIHYLFLSQSHLNPNSPVTTYTSISNKKMDAGLNRLLKWGIENTSTSTSTSTSQADQASPDGIQPSRRGLDAQALQALMGGPSDADLMKESMAAIRSPDISLPNKLIAFDNFEQLIEQIDNANNMQPLGLWTPLLAVLESEEPDLRRMAAWCMGTAVQNNIKAQERVGFLCATSFSPRVL
jgi:hypothetical protein